MREPLEKYGYFSFIVILIPVFVKLRYYKYITNHLKSNTTWQKIFIFSLHWRQLKLKLN